MLRFCRYCFLLLSAALVACSSPVSTQQALTKKVHRYWRQSDSHLKPFFDKVHAKYPPKRLTLVADKRKKTLSLWAPSVWRWRHVRDYPILAASGVLGPKLTEGDGQVPEGIYHPIMLNPQSHFHLSMELNYPNRFDRFRALMDGRTHLGGQIFIHGGRRSVGCLAIGDKNIEDLFVLVYRVGLPNVTVIITPQAEGRLTPQIAGLKVSWLGLLYHQLNEALEAFHPPAKKEAELVTLRQVSATLFG